MGSGFQTMGNRSGKDKKSAICLFGEKGIKVITGAPELEPEALVNDYQKNTLMTGANVWDH